jgi:hypothetical protein
MVNSSQIVSNFPTPFVKGVLYFNGLRSFDGFLTGEVRKRMKKARFSAGLRVKQVSFYCQ